MENTVTNLIEISKKAGEAILHEYGKTATVEWKADDSPLTRADRKSHQVISSELKRYYPDVPILSEEGSYVSYQERSQWNAFWCVDPVDGTKEFIKKTGEFTVNIARIENKKPVAGVIYVPARDLFYYAEKGKGAYKWDRSEGDTEPHKISVRQLDKSQIDIVASRDHAGPGVKKLIDALPDARTKSMGSSLKFCLVAEGQADVYYRDIPTFEWDTAAAQIIVEEAGGSIRTTDGNVLSYNKEDLRNPAVVCMGALPGFWLELINK